ncbi:MAG: peptidyl-tRNA hydrolase, PTH1 family [Verrucomicrobia bacterium]|nr:MAG: peptidyl-tRNA hydrolase, PTH1 family [Verrucomicrobiota bacterium]
MKDDPPIRLVVGLGNPGREYEQTRHNAGFMIADRVAASLGASWTNERKFEAHLARSGSLLILKPQTYMNLSGVSVSAVARFFRLEPPEILVVCDDVALPTGRLRIRLSGSAGGQNGLKSIISALGSQNFPRLRFGVGTPEHAALSDHVLGRFPPDEKPLVDKSLENAANAVILCALRGLTAAMNHFNPSENKPNRSPQKGKKPPLDSGNEAQV